MQNKLKHWQQCASKHKHLVKHNKANQYNQTIQHTTTHKHTPTKHEHNQNIHTTQTYTKTRKIKRQHTEQTQRNILIHVQRKYKKGQQCANKCKHNTQQQQTPTTRKHN